METLEIKSFPLVSVIIPTWNSARTLRQCILSIEQENYPNLEIIVCDGGSSDETVVIAAKMGVRHILVPRGRSCQRNRGALEASGQYLFFVDSDMKISKGVIHSAVRVILSEKKAGVVIPEVSAGHGFWAACKKLEKEFYDGCEWMEAARFFPKSIFLQLGGFDENEESGEDWDLSDRIKKNGGLTRISEKIIHDEGRPTLRGIVAKKVFYAKKFLPYLRKSSELRRISFFSRYFLFFLKPRLAFRHPAVFVGMFFMKGCEFGAGLLAFGPNAFLKERFRMGYNE